MKVLKKSRKSLIFKSLVLFFILIFAVPVFAEPALQGLTVPISDWAYEEGSEGKISRITNIIQEAKAQNYNAIFFEVREAGESVYPHPEVSWSTYFNEKAPGFDPLELALKLAHEAGLQFYAKFDVLKAYSRSTKPQSPDHVFNRHRDWFLKDDLDEFLDYNAAFYLDPMDPEVIAYLKSRVSFLVKEYDLDGISFSGVHYPGDKILSRKAFREKYLLVKDFFAKDEISFAGEAITSCLEALTTEVRLIKPYLFLSAEIHPLRTFDKKKKDMDPADNYFMQDGQTWLDMSIVDALIPLMHDRSKNTVFFYNQYKDKNAKVNNILPSLRGDTDVYRCSDVKKSIDQLKKNGANAFVIYSAGDALQAKQIFDTSAELPYMARTHHSAFAVQLDMSGQEIKGSLIRNEDNGRLHFLDSQGLVHISLSEKPRTLKLQSMKLKMRFETRGWVKPYRYDLISNKRVQRPEHFIELRKAPSFMTRDSSFAFLFRASEGISSINDEVMIPYSNTRIFWKDIPFKPYGQTTKVRGTLLTENEALIYEDIFMGNCPDTTTKHAVLLSSVSPRDTVFLPPDDHLNISFASMMPEELDTVLLYANGKIYPCKFNGKRYVAEIPSAAFEIYSTVYLQVAARDRAGKNYSYTLPTILKIIPEHKFPVLESIAEFSQASYSLGEVRLGGPYMAEFAPGVRFRCDGKFGSNYRLKLSESEYAYIPENEVKELPATTPIPHYQLYNLHVKPDSMKDVLTIPWPEPVPYALLPQPELNRLRLRLFGVQSSSTWLTHLSGLEVIDHVSWEQLNAETYDIYVYLKDNDIWGYDLKQHAGYLTLSVKHPPEKDSLKIAIEAGHGGPWNWGAVGLSGLKEKDINLDTSERLIEILRKKGYDVVEIRPGDSEIKLRDRWKITEEVDADLFVSIHANAAGGDYLRVAGTSTYYHNPFWRSFAELTYENLLELGLDEFGIVGSFNYMMCRMSNRPSILVEKAFMSHAEDENKLADPAFRQTIAEAIAKSIEDYIDEKISK